VKNFFNKFPEISGKIRINFRTHNPSPYWGERIIQLVGDRTGPWYLLASFSPYYMAQIHEAIKPVLSVSADEIHTVAVH